jgi:hypothetical protein
MCDCPTCTAAEHPGGIEQSAQLMRSLIGVVIRTRSQDGRATGYDEEVMDAATAFIDAVQSGDAEASDAAWHPATHS